MWLSIVPILLFGFLMPETLGKRGHSAAAATNHNQQCDAAVEEARVYKAIA
jgi:hypothetical protein